MRRSFFLLLAAVVAIAAAKRPLDDRTVTHVLNRVAFGPRAGDVDRVKRIGLERYIDEQLHPDRIPDRAIPRVAALESLTMSARDLADEPRAAVVIELAQQKLLRGIHSERQLQEVLTDFWFNHFNVDARKGPTRLMVAEYERDTIRPRVLGKFRDLLEATAKSPAMLFYLDNWMSVDPGRPLPRNNRREGLNENYARELMELHTLGVDGGYTQADVTEVARAFTGWTIDRPQTDGHFVFRPIMHDTGEKIVLGQRIPAGGGREDGERVIEILTRHPATARFIATKLVRRFVSDTPPPALVARVAGSYLSTGGDIPAMLRAIFESPEFWSEDAYRAKIKKPFEFVASAVRALGGTTDAQGAMALARASAEIGEPLYQAQPPTGYADRADVWVNAGALLARMNFALGLVSGRYPRVSVELAPLVAGADPRSPAAVLDRLLGVIVADQAAPETRAVLMAQLTDPQITRLSPDDRGAANTDVAKLAALVIGSPDFQRR